MILFKKGTSSGETNKGDVNNEKHTQITDTDGAAEAEPNKPKQMVTNGEDDTRSSWIKNFHIRPVKMKPRIRWSQMINHLCNNASDTEIDISSGSILIWKGGPH